MGDTISAPYERKMKLISLLSAVSSAVPVANITTNGKTESIPYVGSGTHSANGSPVSGNWATRTATNFPYAFQGFWMNPFFPYAGPGYAEKVSQEHPKLEEHNVVANGVPNSIEMFEKSWG